MSDFSGYDEQDVREAARSLAHREVWHNKGLRDIRRQRRLLKYASSEEQRDQISALLEEERKRALHEAESDRQAWDEEHEERPYLEDDVAYSHRQVRRLAYKVGSVILLLVLAFALFVSWQSRETGYTVTIETAEPGARVETVRLADAENRPQVYGHQPGQRQIPESGLVLKGVEVGVGSTGTRQVTASGRGLLLCRIVGKKTLRTVYSGSARDQLTCTAPEGN